MNLYFTPLPPVADFIAEHALLPKKGVGCYEDLVIGEDSISVVIVGILRFALNNIFDNYEDCILKTEYSIAESALAEYSG